MIDLNAIYEAAKELDGIISRTALVPADALNPRAAKVFLKTENLQKTGSFKLRGAYYKISRLTKEETQRGIIASSAGNHAQGVAFAAKEKGIEATICMPESAPLSKIAQTKAYGANIVLCPGVYDDCYAKAVELKKENGYTFVHPFDDLDIIAGQGTAGLEIMQDLPEADVIVVPIGGGGLIAGIALAVKNINPSCLIIGVEAAGAASMFVSQKQRNIIGLEQAHTIADGIAVKKPGKLTFELCGQYVDKFVTVSDSEIASAMLHLIEKDKMIAEASGAASVAAVMYNKIDVSGKKVVCVVSGGNVDVNILPTIINKGLKNTGRITGFSTVLTDKPRQLGALLQIISGEGANIINISHDRSNMEVDIGSCLVNISVETRDHEHARGLIEALNRNGHYCRD